MVTKSITYEVENIGDIYKPYVYMDRYNTLINEYYKCKYCGEVNKDNFKSKAHIIPEFTGNKDWYCLDECDRCNNKFSVYEYNLKHFGAFKNSHLPIIGKKKFPKYVDQHHNFEIQYEDDFTLLMKAKEKGDFFKIENNKVNLTSITLPFVPLYVYKCLSKIAFSLMCANEFKKFDEALPWLHDKNLMLDSNIPYTMLFNPNGNPMIKPVAVLLKREKNHNCPEYTFVFVWGFLMFQIFPPFNVQDKQLDYSNLKLPIYSNFVWQKEDHVGINHFDMNSIKRVRTKESISFFINKLNK